MDDLQARLDRAITEAREKMIGRINQALSATKEVELERALTPMSDAIDHYAALVALPRPSDFLLAHAARAP